jgi:lipopolysaccharide transport system ATP-binding protein
LIIDEALSVGDELFQRKCFSRIEAIRATGATILFVSHAGSTIVELCDRAALMDDGELLTSGATKAVIGKYQRLLYAPSTKRIGIRAEILTDNESDLEARSMDHGSIHGNSSNSDLSTSDTIKDQFDPHLIPKSTIQYESHGAVISTPKIFNQTGERVNCLVRGNTYRYVYDVAFTSAASNVRFGMMVKTQAGVELGGGASAASMQNAIPYVEPETCAHVEFGFQCNLNQGMYFLNAGVVGVLSEEERYLHRVLDAYAFRVMPDDEGYSTGIVDFKCTPEVVQLSCDKSPCKHA